MTLAYDALLNIGLSRLVDFLAESDQIEGILIPKKEYEDALLLNNTSDEDHQYTYTEDHTWALSYVLKNYDRLPNIHDILEIHRRLLANAKLSSYHIGNFRRTDVMVGGQFPPNPASVPYLMDNLFHRLSQETQPDALLYHIDFEIIHPFVDGNGRSGRLFWLWLKLNAKESVSTFLNTAGYGGETFEEKRQNYYQDIKRKRLYDLTVGKIGSDPEGSLRTEY